MDIEDDGWAGYFMRESRVLNWVDPEDKRATPNRLESARRRWLASTCNTRSNSA